MPEYGLSWNAQRPCLGVSASSFRWANSLDGSGIVVVAKHLTEMLVPA
jgi:hypothetical protein